MLTVQCFETPGHFVFYRLVPLRFTLDRDGKPIILLSERDVSRWSWRKSTNRWSLNALAAFVLHFLQQLLALFVVFRHPFYLVLVYAQKLT